MKPATPPTCPACQTPLRLPSRGTAAFKAPCPECGELLWITFRDGQTLVSQNATAESASVRTFPQRPARIPPAWMSGIGSRIASALREPLVLTWLAAGIAACILGVAFYRASLRPTAPPVIAQTDPTPKDQVNPEELEQTAPDQPQTEKPKTNAKPAKPRTPTTDAAPPTAKTKPALIPIPPPVPARLPVVASRPAAVPPPDLRAMAERGLAQRVLRFELTTPTAFETIRGELAEIIGVPIRYAAGTEPITTEVSLTISNAAISEILEQLTRQVSMSYRVDQEGILLIPLDTMQETTQDGPITSAVP